MSRLTSWFRTTPNNVSPAVGSGSTVPDAPHDTEKAFRGTLKAADLDHALASASLMMNDDIDGAVAALNEKDSIFHGLGLGVTMFMRSVLGFEKDVMAEASNKLADVESRSWDELKVAQRKGERHSSVYATGSEYSLVAAESQLMSAVISVLHESLAEGIKGFYRLRKAYITLDAIIEAESKALGAGSEGVASVTLARSATEDHMPGSFDDDEFADVLSEKRKGTNPDEDDDLESVGVKEKPVESGAQTPTSILPEHLAPGPASKSTTVGDLEKDFSDTRVQDGASTTSTSISSKPTSATLVTNPLDIFIHSGTNMCFGLLLLIISMVPPAMSRLLSIIGFRGDRARGVRMLWSASRFHNINGAVAGLVLLAYYNGILGQADILPPTETSSPLSRALFADGEDERDLVGVPREKCITLLSDMRSRFPESGLWRLEEARGLAQQRKLADAIDILTTGERPKMRQVAALNAFELALDSLFAQDWKLNRDSFLRCMELNDWSHCLYYYIAGCAELERYRDAVHGRVDGVQDVDEREREGEIRRRKTRAQELLRKAPTVAGRKKFMSKPLPFDVFAQRKMAKLEERAKELGVDLADAVGVSPALEMAALCCGTKRMDVEALEKMEKGLRWERCTAPPEAVKKMKETPDEVAVRAVTLAAALRCLARFWEARTVLQEEALCYDRNLLKGGLKDDYALPTAYYELAAVAWLEACRPEVPGADDDRLEKMDDGAPTNASATGPDQIKQYRIARAMESQKHLETVVSWEAFVFDTRLGMRVQTGLDTVKWFLGKMET